MTGLNTLVFGMALSLVGAIKTWLHLANIPVLSVPTCNGPEISIMLGSANVFERIHCWGCYALVLGLIVTVAAGLQMLRRDRIARLCMD